MEYEMTPHVHAELIKAWADGAEIEYFDSYEKRWLPTSGGPAWSPDRKYRIKDPYAELKAATKDPTKQIRIKGRDWYGDWYGVGEYTWRFEYPVACYEIRDKPKQKVKMLAYFTGVNLVWVIEYGVTSIGWKRVPTEDKEIEVEE